MSMVHLYDGVRWTSMPCTPPSPPLPNPEDTNPLYFIGNPFLPENLIADEISLFVASTSTTEQQQLSSGAFHRHAGSADTTQSATDDVANELRHAAEDIHSMRSLVQSAVRAAHQQHPSPSSQQAIGERVGFSLSDVAQRTLRGVHPSSSLSPVLTSYANSLIDGIRKPNSGGVGTGNGRQGSAAVDPASVRELLAQERQVVRQRLSVRQDDPHKWHH